MATSTIKLTEDLEHFNLVFTERGEAVDIAFNPRDTDMILRIEKSKENIGKALDEIPDGENNTEVLEKVNTAIRGEIDYIFGATISDKVFKFCGPLALDSKGVTFVERFLAAVTPYITSRLEEANKASAARIAKHTAKYAKK